MEILKRVGKTLVLLLLLGGGLALVWYSAWKLPTGLLSILNVYLILGLIALTFFVLGMLVRVFLSSDSRLDLITKKIDEIRKVLLDRQSDATPGRDSVSSSNAALETLERQIRQLRSQVESSQRMDARLEAALEQLRLETGGIRSALKAPQAPPAQAPAIASPMEARVETPSVQPSAQHSSTIPKVQEQPGRAIEDDPDAPEWRRALNNLLEHIDEGEEE